MSHPSTANPPSLPAYNCGFATGPGPLSPAWPHPPEPPQPRNEFAALAEELTLLRRACVWSLRHPEETAPLMLSLAERADLNRKLAALQRTNARLAHHVRSSAAAAWPSPVLPGNILYSARHLVPLLETAIRVAHAADAALAAGWPIGQARGDEAAS